MTAPRAGGAAWSPSSWFAAGEQGGWWEAREDFDGLYQDSAGTTPVTAVEQPVGLILDKRLGLERGPEGVTNTTLSSGASGWVETTAGTTTSYPNGTARIISPGATPYGGYRQTTAINLVPGRYVEMIVDVAGANASTTSLVVEMTNGGATFIGGTGYKFPFNGGGVYKTIAPMGTVMGNGKVVVSVHVRKNTGPADPGDWVEIRSISVRELPGNHLIQPTATSRPKLTARKNLLTYSEDFTKAVWTKGDTTVSAQGGGVFFVAESATSAAHFFRYSDVDEQPAAAVAAIDVKPNGRDRVQVFVERAGTSNFRGATFNLTSATVTNTNIGAGASIFVGASITPLPDGWYRLSVSATDATNGLSGILLGVLDGAASGSTAVPSYAGDITKGVLVRYPQVERGSTATTYQRVTTATDYDTVGFPHRLKFDGVDDFLQTASIDFTATDKMTVVCGVTHSRVTTEMVLEFSDNVATNTGAFAVYGEFGPKLNAARSASLTGLKYVESSVKTFPLSAVRAVGFDLSGTTGTQETPTHRINGVQDIASSVGGADSGTGNFGNYPLYIGRRAGTSLPFNGELSSLVIRGAASTTEEIEAAEAFAANLHGVTL